MEVYWFWKFKDGIIPLHLRKSAYATDYVRARDLGRRRRRRLPKNTPQSSASQEHIHRAGTRRTPECDTGVRNFKSQTSILLGSLKELETRVQWEALSPEKLMLESLCVEIQVETRPLSESGTSPTIKDVLLTLARDRRDLAQTNSRCHGHKVFLCPSRSQCVYLRHCFSLKVYPCRFWCTLLNGFQFVSLFL